MTGEVNELFVPHDPKDILPVLHQTESTTPANPVPNDWFQIAFGGLPIGKVQFVLGVQCWIILI